MKISKPPKLRHRFTFVKVASAFTLFCGPSLAELPDTKRFVSDKRASGGLLQVVTWVRDAGTFTVSLHKEASKATDTVLLSAAQCREVPQLGYHCFIKPVKRRGILVTDVSIAHTTSDFFDISEVVLINGGVTATSLVGHDFVDESQGLAQ